MMYDKVKIALDALKGKILGPPALEYPIARKFDMDLTEFDLPFQLKKDDNIAGLGIGLKSSGPRADNQECVIVFLSKQISQIEIVRLEAFIHNWLEKSGFGSIPIKTEFIGEVQLLSALINRQRPAECGYRVGNCQSNQGGTLGCLVRETDSGKVCFLSNSHVIARSGNALPNEDIIQPCLNCGGRPGNDTIGTFYRAVPFKPHGINYVDAALAFPVPQTSIANIIAIINKSITNIVPATLGTRIQKVGSTTEHTQNGTITAKHVYIKGIDYPDLGLKLDFDELIMSDLHSEKGDSGSIILNDYYEAVGLNTFVTSKKMAVFSDINMVCKELEIEILIDNS